MGQRKLTDRQADHAKQAAKSLADGVPWEHTPEGDGYWIRVHNRLDAMARHGTTDGKPYAEPQPEIGEGYRPVTEADRTRQDAEFWSQTGGGWQRRKVLIGRPFSQEYHYRVPVDRVPTDEDARQRPTVMVCRNAADGWHARPLLAVTAMGFLVASGDGFTNWKNARFPYPGELD